MAELDAALAQVRNAWIAGRSALDSAPPAWRDAVGADELALLALTGHATDVLTRQVPAAAPATRPLLPALSKPLLPEAQRARFRRLLATPKNAPSWEQPLIHLLAARGYGVHPADWMPSAQDDWTPAFYGPWIDWARAETRGAAEGDIALDTYDQYSWTEKRAALVALRARDRDTAREIISAKAGGESAERRLRLVEVLENGLGEADAAYLESLAKDRSDRVQALARAYLARLGRDGDTGALATELAAVMELRKTGLIKRRAQVAMPPLKTGPQTLRRRELFKLTSLAALARALGVEEMQLVEAAPLGAAEDVVAFIVFVAETGPDDAAHALAEAMIEDADMPIVWIRQLTARIAPDRRHAIADRVLKRDSDQFEATLAITETQLGGFTFAALSSSASFAPLQGHVQTSMNGEDAQRATAARQLDLALPRIGLLLDAAGARAMLAELASWGLSPADPRLDMLHLNAALEIAP